MFEGAALLRRLHRLGVMEESKNKLDECLSLTLENFLKRRLQSRVLDAGMAKSIHHARTLIKGRHIRYVVVSTLMAMTFFCVSFVLRHRHQTRCLLW